MKITVKETIATEIEITFPSFYKTNYNYSKQTYYAFFSEKLGLCITEGFTYQTTPESSMIVFQELVPCDKSEVEQVFKANQKFFVNTMKGITVNPNTPAEVLENL
jgi:hypothetical protein